MLRPTRILLLALTAVAFLAISFGLARVLNANGAERTEIAELLDAQARGDAAAMVAQLAGCGTACRAGVARNAVRLRSQGTVQIVRLDPSTSFSLGGTGGTARVVWRTGSRLTTVQCVGVRRTGDPVRGLHVELHSLSRPIGRTAACPSAR